MANRGENKPVFTLYDLKILNCLIDNRELKVGEIESKTGGTSAHIRERINRLESYGLVAEESRGGRAIFISIKQNHKTFIKNLLDFFGKNLNKK